MKKAKKRKAKALSPNFSFSAKGLCELSGQVISTVLSLHAGYQRAHGCCSALRQNDVTLSPTVDHREDKDQDPAWERWCVALAGRTFHQDPAWLSCLVPHASLLLAHLPLWFIS